LSDQSDPEMMLACDENGAQSVWDGAGDSFGGNHKGRGGHVVKLDTSAAWYGEDNWSGQGKLDILGGVTLGVSKCPDNLVDR